MRNKFDEQLGALHTDLINMGALCEKAITVAIDCFLQGNRKKTEDVFAIERQIDDKERSIESSCLQLLLQQQPVAKDLRTISAALKMVSDMERIGDQAADIAEISIHVSLDEGNTVDYQKYLHKMSEAVIDMVNQSIESFIKSDLELARNVILCDDIVDDLFIRIKNEVVSHIAQDKIAGEATIDIFMIAKYLERIGDHAVNICEWVIFSITGIHKEQKI